MNDLVSILTKIGAPVLASVIGGPVGSLASVAIGALADALGTQPTPEAVTDALNTNPDAKDIALRVESTRKDDLAELQARLADVADARHQTIQLAQVGSKIAWGAPLVTALVLGTFAAVMLIVTWRGSPPGSDPIMIGLIELLKLMSVSCVSYWVGSSAGSKSSGDAIRAIAQQATTPGQALGKVVDAATKSLSKR